MQSYSDSPKVFVSGKSIALWTVILLGVGAMADLAGIGGSAAQLALASTYPETAAAALGPGDVDVSEMPGGGPQLIVSLLEGAISLFGLLIFIATVVVFLIWQHRAYNNLPPLGVPRPDFSSGWVIGSWFVPFLNLIRPYEIVKYIRGKSDPETVDAGGGYYGAGGNSTLKAWWGFWLFGNFVNNLSGRLYWRAEDLSDHVAAGWASIFGSILSVIAAGLAIIVVRDINARQEERHKRLMAASQQQPWSQNYSAGAASPNYT